MSNGITRVLFGIICLLSSIDEKESKNRNNLSLSFISSNFAEIFVSMDSM